MYKLSITEQEQIYKDIRTKSKLALHRYQLQHLLPEDLANDVWILFITQKKMKHYNHSKGASAITYACIVCGNLLKNHLRRGSKHKDDPKRQIADTFSSKTNPYFYNMAKEYKTDNDGGRDA